MGIDKIIDWLFPSNEKKIQESIANEDGRCRCLRSIIPAYSGGLFQFLRDSNELDQKCQARYNQPTNEVINND